MNIIFHNIAHTGDFLFSKSFIKQFCEINNDLNISYLANYNSFLFSDITNLKIITPNKENISNISTTNIINNIINK